MKKSILAVAVLIGTSATFAQDLTSKKGENYLPEAGDWAISIDATPLLGYVQGIFGSNGGTSAGAWSFLNGNNTITGKYFVSDDMAYRGGINIGFNTATAKAYTSELDAAGAPTVNLVVDEMKTSSSNIMLTGGMEWRKGSTRLQGFYGAEVGIGFGGGSNTDYTYANDYTWDGTTGVASQVNAVDGSTDISNENTKGGVMFGLRGFIGAEYFVLPKLAVGGEFGWGLGLQTTGEGTITDTRINAAGTGTEDVTTETVAGGSTFGLGTSNASANPFFGATGSLKITFHF